MKKLLSVVTVLSLAVALVGCGNTTTPKPATNPPASSTQLPPGHPGTGSTTTAQPGNVNQQSQVESKVTDWLNKNYPGDWKLSGTTLSKGSYTENNNYKIVDGLANLFPDNMGVSIFVGKDQRISTSIKMGDQRALDYQVSGAETMTEVFKTGKTVSTQSGGYIKVFMPLKAGATTVGVLTISLPQQ